jgi:hypothetical protein
VVGCWSFGEHNELLPKGQVFQEEIAARIERSSKQNEQKLEL